METHKRKHHVIFAIKKFLHELEMCKPFIYPMLFSSSASLLPQMSGLGYVAPKAELKRQSWDPLIDWKTGVVNFDKIQFRFDPKSGLARLSAFAKTGRVSEVKTPKLIDPDLYDTIQSLKSGFDTIEAGGERKMSFSERRKLAKVTIFDPARNATNPFEGLGKGIARLNNRAGLKLVENDCVLDHRLTTPPKGCSSLAVVSVCEGPGCFDEVLLARLKGHIAITGTTLKGRDDFQPGRWDRASVSACTFDAYYGPVYGYTDTGDVTDSRVLRGLCERVLAKHPDGVHLITADGGFSVEGYENLQDIVSLPMIAAEFAGAIKTLGVHGNGMIKVFDLVDKRTAAILAAVAPWFDDLIISPPRQSRPANSERYVVLLDKKRLSVQQRRACNAVFDVLARFASDCTTPAPMPGKAPFRMTNVPASIICDHVDKNGDALIESLHKALPEFARSFATMQAFLLGVNNDYAKQQVLFLRAIQEGIDRKMSEGSLPTAPLKFVLAKGAVPIDQGAIADRYLEALDLSAYIGNLVETDKARHQETLDACRDSAAAELALVTDAAKRIARISCVALCDSKNKDRFATTLACTFEPSARDVPGVLFCNPTSQGRGSGPTTACKFVPLDNPYIEYLCPRLSLPYGTVLLGFANIVEQQQGTVGAGGAGGAGGASGFRGLGGGAAAAARPSGHGGVLRRQIPTASLLFKAVMPLRIAESASVLSPIDFSEEVARRRTLRDLVANLASASVCMMTSLLDRLLLQEPIDTWAGKTFVRVS